MARRYHLHFDHDLDQRAHDLLLEASHLSGRNVSSFIMEQSLLAAELIVRQRHEDRAAPIPMVDDAWPDAKGCAV